MATSPACPENAFLFNSTLCACRPGYFMDAGSRNCTIFVSSSDNVTVETGVDYSHMFPNSIISFNSIKKFTQSQALFLEITVIVVVVWIVFCVSLRAGKIDGGRSIWFRMRQWIRQMDVCYSTQHYVDDQKPLIKRKTELGGMFSVACAILFLGLNAALLYQIIDRRKIEVQNMIPVNAPDLIPFVSDMEFSLTAISSMTCSNLRGLGTLVSGTSGVIVQRTYPLSKFADAACQNTSLGPKVTLKCKNCHVSRDSYFISWQFVDLPSEAAMAVGFLFSITSNSPNDTKHVSYVNGTLTSENSTNQPATFRGLEGNIFEFHLIPRKYHNVHDLRLIQPLFREFVPGSNFVDASQLQRSLQNTSDGLINMTLYINFLSDYIVQVNNANVVGPVSFVADVGGLYAFCLTIFLFLLLQSEFRSKKLRNEAAELDAIRSRKRAQKRWDKLRKYVMYTWGANLVDDKSRSYRQKKGSTMVESGQGHGSLQKRKQRPLGTYMAPFKLDTLPANALAGGSKPSSHVSHVVAGDIPDMNQQRKKDVTKDKSLQPELLSNNLVLAIPPVPEISVNSGMDMSEMQKNLQSLYEFNICLRENLLASQAVLADLMEKASQPDDILQQ